MSTVRIAAIWTFPEHGQPGRSHFLCGVSPDGLDGDRRKKAPLSMIGLDGPGTRANLVLDCPTATLMAWDGRALRVGRMVLAATATGTSCPGLYAAVEGVGELRVGDEVVVLDD